MSVDPSSDESVLTKEWIELNEELNRMKNNHKSHRNPVSNTLIAIGTCSTVAALSYGLYCSYLGNSAKSQKMMRARIAAQGFTFVISAFAFVSAAIYNNKVSEKKS